MTPTRRSFVQLAALIPALAVPVAAKPKVIRLRDIEHEYDPRFGEMGRGVPVSWEQVDDLDTTGYQQFVTPGSRVVHFPVYGYDGKPTGDTWVGWIREERGRHLVAAIELGPFPKTPEAAEDAGWKRWSPPGSSQYIFPIYRADGTPAWTSWTSFCRGPLRVNFEVPA